MKALASHALALFVLSLFSAAATAQTPPPQFIDMLTVTVKPGSAPEYEAFVKKIIAGADKIGLPAPAIVHGFQMARGGAGNTYVFVFPFNQIEELDGFGPSRFGMFMARPRVVR